MSKTMLRIIGKAMSGIPIGFILALSGAILISILAGIFYLLTGQGDIAQSAGVSTFTTYTLVFYFVLPVGVFGGFIFGLMSGINNPEQRELSPFMKSLLSNALMLIIGYVLFCILFFVLT